MSETDLLIWALRQNYHADKSNAAIHCSEVRFSPITFKLAEMLEHCLLNFDVNEMVQEVSSHAGLYTPDPGRIAE